jgi:hypothetical protein
MTARRWRRPGPVLGRLLAAAAAAIATVIGSVGVLPGVATSAPPSGGAAPGVRQAGAVVACSRAAGTHVAFVIDLGPRVARVCVTMPSDDTDAQALYTVSSALHWAAPRYASSGLLCAIDDQPTHGCGTLGSHGYAYWSYWDGSASRWTYGSGDPSTTTVSSGTTVGWRWQPEGAGNPTDPAPRGPSDPADVCLPGQSAGVTPPLTCESVVSTSPPPATTTTAPSNPATGHPGSGPTTTTVGRSPVTSHPTTSTTRPRSATRTPATGTPATKTPASRTPATKTPAAKTPATETPGSPTSTLRPHSPAARARHPSRTASVPPGASTTPSTSEHPTTAAGSPVTRLASGEDSSAGPGATPYVVVVLVLGGLTAAVVTARRRRRRAL